MAGPVVWAREGIAEVRQNDYVNLTTTVAEEGLGHARPASNLPVLSSKAWLHGSISNL